MIELPGYQAEPVIRDGELVGVTYTPQRTRLQTWVVFGPVGKWASRGRYRRFRRHVVRWVLTVNSGHWWGAPRD